MRLQRASICTHDKELTGKKNPSLAHGVYPRKDEIMVSSFIAEADCQVGGSLYYCINGRCRVCTVEVAVAAPLGVQFATHQEKKDTQGC